VLGGGAVQDVALACVSQGLELSGAVDIAVVE